MTERELIYLCGLLLTAHLSLSLLSSLLPTDSDVSDTGNALRPFVGVGSELFLDLLGCFCPLPFPSRSGSAWEGHLE